MEILHKGVDPKTLPFVLECYNCKSIVKLVESELKTLNEKTNGLLNEYVDCPCCSDKIYYSPENQAVAEKHLKEKKRKKEEETYVDMREISYGDSRERSGGASGPQLPPELPKFVTFTKNLANVK